jgi:hypothetical protein
MSLLSSILLPMLEKELVGLEPQICNFLLGQFKLVANEVIIWAEDKLQMDINGDGQIG